MDSFISNNSRYPKKYTSTMTFPLTILFQRVQRKHQRSRMFFPFTSSNSSYIFPCLRLNLLSNQACFRPFSLFSRNFFQVSRYGLTFHKEKLNFNFSAVRIGISVFQWICVYVKVTSDENCFVILSFFESSLVGKVSTHFHINITEYRCDRQEKI